MRIQHGLDIDVLLRLDPGLRITQCQDSVKRVLPAVDFAACLQHQIATIGIVLATQQIAAAFHANITAPSLRQLAGIRCRGRHARLGRRAGGNVFHFAAGSERDIAATQRADALPELVEAHPPGGLECVRSGGLVQLSLAE